MTATDSPNPERPAPDRPIPDRAAPPAAPRGRFGHVPPFLRRGRVRAAAALLVAFGAGGALIHLADGPRRTAVVALAPQPIAGVKDGGAALKGQVAEVFGDKFVIADDTGRALVETGPAGRGAALVKPGETVTAQGRFDHGSLHAAVLSHADGRQDAFDPGPGGPGGPPRPPGPPLHAGP